MPQIMTAQEQATTTESQLSEEVECWCVPFARLISHFKVPWVRVASDLPITAKQPVPGALILFNYNHTGTILHSGTSTVTFVEKNFAPCKITVRTLPLNHPSIRGYYVNYGILSLWGKKK